MLADFGIAKRLAKGEKLTVPAGSPGYAGEPEFHIAIPRNQTRLIGSVPVQLPRSCYRRNTTFPSTYGPSGKLDSRSPPFSPADASPTLPVESSRTSCCAGTFHSRRKRRTI